MEAFTQDDAQQTADVSIPPSPAQSAELPSPTPPIRWVILELTMQSWAERGGRGLAGSEGKGKRGVKKETTRKCRIPFSLSTGFSFPLCFLVLKIKGLAHALHALDH